MIQRAEAASARRIALWHEQVQWTEFVAVCPGDCGGRADRPIYAEPDAWVSVGVPRVASRSSATGGGDLRVGAEAADDADVHRRRRDHLRRGGSHPDHEPRGRGADGLEAGAGAGQPLDKVFHIVNETTRQIGGKPGGQGGRLNRIVGLANHTVLIRRDGTELQIADSGAPIRDKDGRDYRDCAWCFAM